MTLTTPVSVYMEANPNPDSLKFVFNSMLLPDGISKDFADTSQTLGAPLAATLFTEFPFVERVFFTQNFITLTKNRETEWEAVKNQVREFLVSYAQEEKPFFTEEIMEAAAEAEPQDQSPEAQRIRQILNEYVRPAVEMDGGAIHFHDYDKAEGRLAVTLKGACSGCPSSIVTLKSGIENLFQQLMPEVKQVVAHEG
ncbi:MAG: NifU family protein [Bacteroidota bacterium]